MPRKAKPPPMNLLIQGLSDHRTMRPQDAVQANEFVDDFTGEVHAVKPEALAKAEPEYVATAPIMRVNTSKVSQRDQARKRAKSAQRVVMSVFRPEPKLMHQAKRGERAIPLGDKLTVIMPAKPWRRV